jgi:hypothetical protein
MTQQPSGLQLIEMGLTSLAPMHLGPIPENRGSFTRFEQPVPSQPSGLQLIEMDLTSRAPMHLGPIPENRGSFTRFEQPVPSVHKGPVELICEGLEKSAAARANSGRFMP